MPKLSAFTRCGHLVLSSQEPLAQRIYEAMVAAYGGDENFDSTFDSPHSADLYAQAMGLATQQLTCVRAGNNADPGKAGELLPELALDWGITPSPGQTDQEKRADLIAARRYPLGARRENVERLLRELLGTGFLGYRTALPTDVETWPATPQNGPGNWKAASEPVRLYQTSTIVDRIGVPIAISVTYKGGSADAFIPGDVIVLEAGRHGRAERCTITAVGTGTITVTCTTSHDSGVWVVSGMWPYWFSTQRYELIVVSAAVLADPVLRRKLNTLLHQLLRGVSQWAVVGETAPGVIGPFTVNHGLIGHTPIGQLAY